MEGVDLILPMAGTAGVASWIGTMVANKTNLANLKKRLDEVIQELKALNDKHHQLDKEIEILKIRNLGNNQ